MQHTLVGRYPGRKNVYAQQLGIKFSKGTGIGTRIGIREFGPRIGMESVDFLLESESEVPFTGFYTTG